MVNIYDTANQLAEDLQKTPEFEALKKEVEAIKNDPESLKLYQEMDQLQKKIMVAQQSGQPLPDDVKKEYEEINQKVSKSEALKNMILKEQKVFQIVNQVQQAFTKPIGDLYKEIQADK